MLDLNSDKSIYVQVAEIIENEILMDNLKEDEQAPSTNQFAKIYNINPATSRKGLNLISVNLMYGPMLMVGENVSFAGSNLFAVLVYLIFYSRMIYHENFSLAVAFGASRRNSYLHIVVNNIMIVVISAVVQRTVVLCH